MNFELPEVQNLLLELQQAGSTYNVSCKWMKENRDRHGFVREMFYRHAQARHGKRAEAGLVQAHTHTHTPHRSVSRAGEPGWLKSQIEVSGRSGFIQERLVGKNVTILNPLG